MKCLTLTAALDTIAASLPAGPTGNPAAAIALHEAQRALRELRYWLEQLDRANETGATDGP